MSGTRTVVTRQASRFLAGPTLVILLLPAPIWAQQELRLSPMPTCDSCNIEIEHLLSFGKQEGAEFLDGGAYVFEEGERFFYAVQRDFLYEIGVFDKGGRFVRSVGSMGEGPGEYRFIVDIEAGPGDSLFVFDSQNQRVTVLTPEFNVARTFQLRGRSSQRGAAFLPDGTLLANVVVADTGGILPPLHHLDPDGTVLGRIGERTEWTDYGRVVSGNGSLRVIAPSKAGGFWKVQGDRFEILHLDLEGKVLSRIELMDWVEEAELEERVQRGYPPTTLMDITEDSDGLVWVLIRVPDPRWKDQVKITGGFGGMPRNYEVNDRHGYWDTLIGVIDPIAGELLDLIRTPTWYLYFTRPGVLLSREADELDRMIMHFWSVSLRRYDPGAMPLGLGSGIRAPVDPRGPADSG